MVVGVLIILVGANRTLSATNNLTLTYGYIAVSGVLTAAAATYVNRRTQAHLESAQRAQRRTDARTDMLVGER